MRRCCGSEVTVAVMNAGAESLEVRLPWSGTIATDAMTGQQVLTEGGVLRLSLPGISGVLLI